MNVEKIVKEWLLVRDYDGLYHQRDDGEDD